MAQTKRGTPTNQEAMLLTELYDTERRIAGHHNAQRLSSQGDSQDRWLTHSLVSGRAAQSSKRLLPASHSLPSLAGVRGAKASFALPTSLAAARLQGGWTVPHGVTLETPEAALVRRALRQSRSALKLQRLPVDTSAATGPRPYSVRWLPYSAEHPRTSMPYSYGQSLHANNVLGLDLNRSWDSKQRY
jgi:hypothetical protein